jgi:hypothetical protein
LRFLLGSSIRVAQAAYLQASAMQGGLYRPWQSGIIQRNRRKAFQSAPLRVHLVFAITQRQAGKATTIAMPNQRFSVPDFGVCSPQTGWAPHGWVRWTGNQRN